MKFYEMRTYTTKVGQLANYVKLFETIGAPIITKYLKLVGFWYSEVGEMNQVVHIWEYENFEDRIAKRKALYKDPEWCNDFLPTAGPMLVDQKNQILFAANFSPIK